MRFREPLLGGSAAMPGASLQRACRLLVAVCALHLGVTLVYYLTGRDLSRLPYLVGVSTPLQAGSNGAAAIGQPSRELRPPPPLDASSEPRRGRDSSPDADPRPGLSGNLTSAPVSPTTALSLPACPEESPLLGKDSEPGRSRISPAGPPDVRPCPPSGQPACLFRIRVPNPKQSSGLEGGERLGGGPSGFMLDAGARAVWGSRRPLGRQSRRRPWRLPCSDPRLKKFWVLSAEGLEEPSPANSGGDRKAAQSNPLQFGGGTMGPPVGE